MTKISQKEYIGSLVDIVKDSVENLVFKNMIEEFNYIEHSYHPKDVTLVCHSLILETMIKIENSIKSFITEKGVPRKQRVKKEEKKNEKNEKNIKNEEGEKEKTNDEIEKEREIREMKEIKKEKLKNGEK